MENRTESLTIALSKEEKTFIIQCANETCLSVADYLVLSALSIGSPTSSFYAKTRGSSLIYTNPHSVE